MGQKKIDRRKFLVNSLKGAAGIGVLAGCDKRTVIGTDIRSPSAPTGLTRKISKTGNDISVALSWTPHDLTDITGVKTESGVTFNVYRDNVLLAQNLTSSTYNDNTGLVEDKTYMYALKAVDTDKNESPFSQPLTVPIQKFVNVYKVTNPAVATAGTSEKFGIKLAEVKKMVDAVVMAVGKEVTGQSAITVAAAWESLFPGLSVSSLIGIKINTLGCELSTKPQVVDAIVAGLTQMLGNTFPEHNIIVFDDRDKDYHMKKAGFYPLRDTADKYRITSIKWNTTLNGVPISTAETDAQKWLADHEISNVSQPITALVNALDFIINVPILKDHSSAGISFALKNFYGIVKDPSKLHGSWCDPYIPAVYDLEINGTGKKVKDKVKIIIGDAIIGCSTGGPVGDGTIIYPNAIIAGTDPVAMDSLALDMINSYRSAANKPRISYDPDGGARHILTASTKYLLGSTNYALKEVPLV